MLLVRSLLFNLVLWLWSASLVLILVPAAPFVSPPSIRRYAAFWMRGVHLALAWIVGLRFRVQGLEHLPDGPCIIASKHQSSFETLLFHTIRPDIAIGLKEELIRIPLFGWYLKIAQNIAIDRGGAAKAMRSLVKGAETAVENGLSILIFPEGNRRPVDAAPDYKPGVAALYKALDVPVVPVGLDSGRFWPRRSFAKRPGMITVRFLEPIPPGLDRQAFMRLLEERTEAGCAEIMGMDGKGAADGRVRPPVLDLGALQGDWTVERSHPPRDDRGAPRPPGSGPARPARRASDPLDRRLRLLGPRRADARE